MLRSNTYGGDGSLKSVTNSERLNVWADSLADVRIDIGVSNDTASR